MALETTKDQPWTVDRFCRLWNKARMPTKHPRFHWVAASANPSSFSSNGYFVPEPTDTSSEQLLVSKKEEENSSAQVERHVSESLVPMMPRSDIIQRIQRLQTEAWNLSESLWYVDIIPWMKAGGSGMGHVTPVSPGKRSSSKEIGESLLMFRGHHVLADGASLGAAWLDMADEVTELKEMILTEMKKRGFLNAPWWKRLIQQLLFILWLLTGSVQSFFYQLQLIFQQNDNPWAILEQRYNEQREHQSNEAERSVSFTTVGSVEQAKWVARTLAGRKATVNDVFCAAVSKALSKQLQWHRERFGTLEKNTQDGRSVLLPPLNHTHLAVPVHLKGGVILPGESVSNSIGAFCVRVPCEEVQGGKGSSETGKARLQKVHKELDKVKKRPTAFVGHYVAKIATQVLPASWVAWSYSRVHGGASCVVTNVRGLDRQIHMDGSPVLSMYGFVPLPPRIPIGVVVSSYNGKVHLTMSAQPWAVPDADQFLSWILDEYLLLVQEAKLVATTKTTLS